MQGSVYRLLLLCSLCYICWGSAIYARVDREVGPTEENVADSLKDFFGDNTHIYAVAGGGAGLILLILLIIIIGCCCCYKRRTCCFKRRRYLPEKQRLLSNYRPPDALYSNRSRGQVEVGIHGRLHERSVAEELRRQKEQQEQADRDNAKYVVEFYLRNDAQFKMVDYLPDMGSRMLKFWFKVRDRSNKDYLLTLVPVAQKCPLNLDVTTIQTINKLLRMLSHPNLHTVQGINYVPERRQIITIQSISKGGSLKDRIYRSTYNTEWTMKYSRRSRGLSTNLVRLYGKQILEALLYLYGQGFPPLGHVQTGNIFVDGEVCRLGGYENTLLGYKTRSYKLCRSYMDDIDLILFGHVLFEMACGYELTSTVPGEQEYKSVREPQVRDVLQVIFEQNQKGELVCSIEEVHNHPFFREMKLPIQEGARHDHTQFPSDVKNLLSKVARKPRVQKTSNKEKKRKRTGHHQEQPGSSSTAQATPTTSASKAAFGPSSPSDADLAHSKTAVLDAIRGDRPQLKKTETDDRSAPRLD